MGQWSSSRRQFFRVGIVAGTVGVAGCTRSTDSDATGAATDTPSGTEPSTDAQSLPEPVFEDQFDDGVYTSAWGVKPGHGSPSASVSEADGSLTHIVENADSAGAGNITTVDDFAAEGTGRLVTRLRTQSTDYSGFGFVLSFGSAGQEGGLTLTETNTEDEDGLRLNEWEAGTAPEVLADRTDSTDWTEYAMTVDFDTSRVTRVSRGDTVYELDYEFGTDYSDVFVVELGNGRNHRIQYDYFRLESL